ncbi:MAG: Ig-like domain-containing protein, partial [Paludibacteraceae bacterium]|nr:Ig-like domain-containing protein [Paludibacteraceae bacterium]
DVTLHAGESVNLSAKINFQKDGKNVVTTIEKKVNWESSNFDVATIDANGKVTAVKGGTAIITAECQGTKETCAISVKDIFVAGSLELSDSEKLAVIWQKCDTGAFVKYSLENAEFTAMEVNELGIYYAGIENGTAKVWKDETILNELGENITVTSMCIANGNVYVSGYESISDKFVARVWKDGSEILNFNSDITTYAYDVLVEKGKVYVAGAKFREKTALDLYDAIIWVDGVETPLEKPAGLGNETAQAKSICINKGAIYVGGSVDEGSNEKPYIWKDGESCFDFKTDKGSVKNIKFMNNVLYAFYGTTLLMGDVKSNSTDMMSIMIQAKGDGYIDAIESLGSVYVVAQGYPQYANGKTDEIESGYNKTALATILLKDNGMVDFLPRSMRANGDGEPEYPRSNAVAIGIR